MKAYSAGSLLSATHKPRILLLCGSTRMRSFSRLLTEETVRLIERFGAETRIFDPSGLPLPGDASDSHPKVQALRPKAIHHPAHVNWINQFDAAH
ncbi:NADPH-dependent FMN reductase [Metapseudomonas boanensis]